VHLISIIIAIARLLSPTFRFRQIHHHTRIDVLYHTIYDATALVAPGLKSLKLFRGAPLRRTSLVADKPSLISSTSKSAFTYDSTYSLGRDSTWACLLCIYITRHDRVGRYQISIPRNVNSSVR